MLRAHVWMSIAAGCTALFFFAPASAQAQGSGTVVGQVHDSARAGVEGATVHLLGTALDAVSDVHGYYRLVNVPAGTHRVTARRVGFTPDTFSVMVASGATVTHDALLHSSAVRLADVAIRSSPRMAETKAAALTKQQNASNIVSVLSGDEIRSLPNFNAAEAAGRIPGVSLERDEGEGKFVQVRGTEPRLSNVTIDGVHVPGTEDSRCPSLTMSLPICWAPSRSPRR